MIKDRNKGIATNITYNHLNLPLTITINNGQESGTISYLYDATGVKLQKTFTKSGMTPKITQYAGNFMYDDNETSGTMKLQFFNHPEGYILPVANTESSVKGSSGGVTTYSSYGYVFQFKDHLGNVRLSYQDSDLNGSIDTGANANEIIEESNYYPFGLKQKGYNNYINGTENNYHTYVGKEFNESLGLNLMEMNWRQHDPAIGRFIGIDKYAESFQKMTPYHYGNNNPIVFSDPTGLFSTVVNGDGEVVDHDNNDGDSNIYLDNRSGPIIGQEEEGREYNKGDKIFDVDRSHSDYAVFSLLASSTATAANSAVSVFNVAKEIPVYDDSGNQIGRWITKIKVPFKALKIINGVLQAVGPAFDVISIGANTVELANGNMTVGRYTFNTLGTGASIYAGFAAGGPAGITVGGVIYLGDLFIQAAEVSHKQRLRAAENSKHKIHNTNIFSKAFWQEVGSNINFNSFFYGFNPSR